MISRSRSLSLLGAVAAAAAGLPARAQAAPITIAASTFDSSTSGVYAAKAGLFKNAGLNVVFTPMNVSAILPALAGGSIQFANSNLLNVIEGHARKAPFTVVAPSAYFNESDIPGYIGMVAKKEAAIASGRDLNGKIVAVPSIGDLNTLASRSYIDKNGGDSTTVKFIEMPAPSALTAVIDGRVDATILNTPFLMTALEGGKVKLVTDAYNWIAPRFLGLGWLTTEDYAAKDRDAVEKFVRVMHDANIYCNAHQAETADMMAELAKADPLLERRMKRIQFAEYLVPAEIQPLIDVSAKYKVIEAAFPAQDLISPLALKPSR